MYPNKECYLIEVGYSFKLPDGERSFARNEYIPYRAISNFCDSRRYYGAYRSTYRYDSYEPDTANLYGDYYLDFDSEEDFDLAREDAIKAIKYLEVVMRIMPENIKIFFSGCKGVHLIIPAEHFAIEPNHYLNEIFKYMSQCIRNLLKNKTLDLRVYDKKRLFRIPNTIHEKTGLYKTQLTYRELTECTIEEIKKKAKFPGELWEPEIVSSNKEAKRIYERMVIEFLEVKEDREKKNKIGGNRTLNFMPPCIKYLLENGAQKGQRNISISCLVVYFKNTGMSLEGVIEEIKQWNGKNTSSVGTSELTKTVNSMYHTDKNFGCSTLESVSVCEPSLCKLYKKEK